MNQLVKTCDIPGMLSALKHHIEDLLKGGIADWMQLFEINYSLSRLILLDRQWQPHDPIPFAVNVRVPEVINVRTPSNISRCGDLLVGFVRLHSVSEPTILHLTIGAHDFSQVCLGADAGSFVYAHDNRFVIPLVSIQFSALKCTNLNENNIGIVYALLRREERCGLIENRIFVHVDIDETMTYSSGVVLKNKTNACTNDHLINDLIELPDMYEIGTKQRSLKRPPPFDRAQLRAQRPKIQESE